METTKICSKCKVEQPLTGFCKSSIHKDGLRPSCNDCKRRDALAYKATPIGAIRSKASAKRHRDKTKDTFREYKRKWREERKQQGNPEYVRTECAVFFKVCPITNQWFTTKTANAIYSREGWKIKRREVQKSEAYKEVKCKRRRISDARLRAEKPMFKIRQNVSRSINQSLLGGKGGPWQQIVGFTLEDLRIHLEAQFTEGMSWENYGRTGWHIDHVRPVASFAFTSVDDAEFKQCWALENLQPLWWYDNLKKGAQYESDVAA